MLQFFLGLAFIFTVQAEAKFKTPWLSGPVIDEVGILNSQDKAQLEQMILSAQQSGAVQLQVFITDSLQGLTIEQASIEITDQWKLGTKDKDNGVLFLVAPNEKKVRIEVGQGLEGNIPDIYAKRINEDIVVPYFRQGRMSQGIVQGAQKIIELAQGGQIQEEDLPQKSRRHKEGIPFWAIVLIWIIILFIGRMGGPRGRRMSGGFWTGVALGGLGGGRGGGGGGWSGGGGGFSGGGSSSSW